ncbi:MAG TPA: NHL repeat-containing protein [Blastocatellia bacterium]|jgi:sugar lactone lactonase YvrE|nr:NHL repeat-containing protein [Blastocatellia bacterium]
MQKILLAVLLLATGSGIALISYFALKAKPVPTLREGVGVVTRLAGSGRPGLEDGPKADAGFSDPFGIAVDGEGNVLVSDAGAGNRIRRITPAGSVETLAGSGEGFSDGPALAASFNTPSGIAIDADGNVIIADTSNNRIRKLDRDGRVSTIAGSGASGYKDGPALEAEFDGPIGVAVDASGNIFVADAYNDRIRKITREGAVSTVAGGVLTVADNVIPQLFAEPPSNETTLDTPCGIAADGQGNVYVADTGNDQVLKIDARGVVVKMWPRLEGFVAGGGSAASFDKPVSLALTHDGFLFVVSEGGQIHRISPDGEISLFAGSRSGFADGIGERARFNGPSGIAVDLRGNVYVTDTQNYLIRQIAQAAPGSAATSEEGQVIDSQPPFDNLPKDSDSMIPRLSAESLGIRPNFPWPLNPQNQAHEVTGVFGEARGAPGGIALHHVHSGLDVRGNMGEAVVSVLDEKVSSPLPAWGFSGANEGVRIGVMSYIHIRVGRDVRSQVQAGGRFRPRLDYPAGVLTGIRLKRGTRFRVGDFIGTLNQLYHVHMNLGPWNAQANPIILPLTGFEDTVAPVIEPRGIEVASSAGALLSGKRDGRLLVSGDVDILVTAYDRTDGNTAARKLGIYRIGYQLLNEDGSPLPGFEEPLINMEFNRMPPGDEATFVIFAQGSGVSAYGTPTKFKYIITNRVRDGVARDSFLRTSLIPPGKYVIKVFAEDFAGNRAAGKEAELPIIIPAS